MAQATIATTVTGLQGHPVATTAPSIVGQLLTWNGSAWAPDNTTYMPVAGGTFTGAVTLAGAATQPNQPATLTQVATAAGVNIGRNYVHNSQFSINQRGSASYSGTSPFAVYSADRWVIATGAAGDTLTTTQAAASDADRAAIGLQNCTFYMSNVFAGGANAANFVQLSQRIENLYRLSNKTCTISFWAYSPTSQRLGVAQAQYMGTGGSPTGGTSSNIGVAALTTGWQRYSFTFTVPSMAGQTPGTNGDGYTALLLWASCPPASGAYAVSGNLGAQSGTINIWGVQLEVGSQATPFELRDPEIELALCQRFYYGPGTIQNGGASYSTAEITLVTPLYFPVTMRASPTTTVVASFGIGVTLGTETISSFNGQSGQISIQAPAGNYAYAVTYQYTASADL